MLLHDMGVELESSTGYYGAIVPAPRPIRNDKFEESEQPSPAEWRHRPALGSRRLGTATSTTAVLRRWKKRSPPIAVKPAM